MIKTISILVENKAGMLVRVTNLFSRRGYNIESLAVGITENAEISRITVIVDTDERILDQIVHQLMKLVGVIKVKVLDDDAIITRELVLIKVKADSSCRNEIIQIAEIFRARIIDLCPDSLTIELTGQYDKTNALLSMIEKFGIIEVARTGKVSLSRGIDSINS